MHVLWFTNIVLPEAAAHFGVPPDSGGGWMSSLLDGIRGTCPEITVSVVTGATPAGRRDVNGVRYYNVGGRALRHGGVRIPVTVAGEIAAIVKAENPDVMHIHGSERFYGSLPGEVFGGRPVILSIQGILAAYAPYYSGGLMPAELAPFRTLRNRLRCDDVFACQRQFCTGGEREAVRLRAFKHYAGRTDWDRAWLAKYNPAATYHVWNEVVRPEFRAHHWQLDRATRHVIYSSASAVYPLKGLHWLLRAMATVKRACPDAVLRIANVAHVFDPPKGLAGWLRNRDYPAYLRSLVARLGIQENMVPLPKLSGEQVARELERAHVYCLPSLIENSPNSLAEAMIVGTPVVATATGGIPSMLPAGTGVQVPICDEALLAKKILDLFANDDAACRLSEAAARLARGRHDAATCARRAREVYAVIAQKGGSS